MFVATTSSVSSKLSNIVFFLLADLLLGVSFPRPGVFRRQLCSAGTLLSLFAPQSVLLDAHTGKRCLSNTLQQQNEKNINYVFLEIIPQLSGVFMLPIFVWISNSSCSLVIKDPS